jgi:hypothetical protein
MTQALTQVPASQEFFAQGMSWFEERYEFTSDTSKHFQVIQRTISRKKRKQEKREKRRKRKRKRKKNPQEEYSGLERQSRLPNKERLLKDEAGLKRQHKLPNQRKRKKKW